MALGSNVSNRVGRIKRALLDLENWGNIEKVSNFYLTYPFKMPTTAEVLNCCIRYETLLYPAELLELVESVERVGGRRKNRIGWKRRRVYSKRSIDIDIILWENGEWISERLVIPHREWIRRYFVRIPAVEVMGENFGKILNEVESTALVDSLNLDLRLIKLNVKGD